VATEPVGWITWLTSKTALLDLQYRQLRSDSSLPASTSMKQVRAFNQSLTPTIQRLISTENFETVSTTMAAKNSDVQTVDPAHAARKRNLELALQQIAKDYGEGAIMRLGDDRIMPV
jgi:hypothetical protein